MQRGGRDSGTLRFELGSLALHLGFYLRSVRRFLGMSVPLSVPLTDFHQGDRTALIRDALMMPLRQGFPEVRVGFDHEREAGRGYYRDLCFHLLARTPAGEVFLGGRRLGELGGALT